MDLAQKLTLLKSRALWSGGYKNRYNKPGNMAWSNFSIKILDTNVDNFISDNSNWTR